MLIFYTASYYGKAKFQKYYDLVLDALQNQKVKIISPELSNYKNVLQKDEIKALNDPDLLHYTAIKKGIEAADAVVIEISHQDFQLGWEASLACQAKKPLLCLSMHEDFSRKIQHRYFHAAKYNEYTIDNLIEEFIQKATKNHLNQRFNFFLSPAQIDYLKKESEKSSQSTASIIRSLIDHSRLQK